MPNNTDQSTMFSMDLGNNLRNSRGKQCLTIDDIALKLGMDRREVTAIEKGHKHLSIFELLDYCALLNFDISSVIPEPLCYKKRDLLATTNTRLIAYNIEDNQIVSSEGEHLELEQVVNLLNSQAHFKTELNQLKIDLG